MHTIDPDGTYLKRDIHHVLIRTYYARGFSWGIFLCFGTAGLFIMSLEWVDGSSYEYPGSYILLRGGLCFFLAGFFFARPYFRGSVRPRYPLEHHPQRLLLQRLADQLMAGGFIGLFLSIFFTLLDRTPSPAEIRYLLYLFVVLFGGMILYRITNIVTQFVREGRFGPSYLRPHPFDGRLGSVLRADVHNAFYAGGPLTVRLLNLEDHAAYAYNGPHAEKKNNGGYLTQLHYRAEQQVHMQFGVASIEFALPRTGRPSHYHPANPVYWLVEAEGEGGYRAQFTVDVGA